MNKRAIVFLADGFEETEALAPVDIMRRSGVEVSLITINQTTKVTSSHNIVITADKTTKESIGEYDLLFIPGGMPGTTNLNTCEAVRNEVVKAFKNGKILAAICAGPMVLGELGILKGKKATCYPGFESHLHEATVTGTGVVVDGNIITGIGAGVSLNLGIEMVAKLIDRETANKIAAQIQMNK